jgi:hypothetical protein
MKKPNRPPSLKDIKPARPADVVPHGWFSRQDCEKEWGLSATYTYKLIQQALQTKRATIKKFNVPTPSRGVYPTPHYKFKGKG